MVKRLASQCDVVEWLFDWYKRSAIIINFHWHQIRLVKLEARFVSSFSSLFIKKKNDNKKLDRVRIRRTCLWHCFESTEKKSSFVASGCRDSRFSACDLHVILSCSVDYQIYGPRNGPRSESNEIGQIELWGIYDAWMGRLRFDDEDWVKVYGAWNLIRIKNFAQQRQ